MIVLGRFGAAFGVKGWLKVESYTDPPEGLLKYPELSVASRGGTWEPVKILTGRRHGNGRTLVVAVEGISSPEAAQIYGTREIAVPRSALPPTKPGEVYWEDLIGCTAVTLEGVELGVVRHFLDFPGKFAFEQYFARKKAVLGAKLVVVVVAAKPLFTVTVLAIVLIDSTLAP